MNHPSTLPRTREPRRILVVDDDPGWAGYLATKLAGDGYCVEVLGNGAEAVERIQRAPRADAIVSGLVMPQAGGLAVVGAAHVRWTGVPVILVTRYSDLLVHPGVPFGPTPTIFAKPVPYGELHAALQRLLDGR